MDKIYKLLLPVSEKAFEKYPLEKSIGKNPLIKPLPVSMLQPFKLLSYDALESRSQ